MKLTVYIVDDEPMAVRYLETLLAGTSLDLEVMGTAPNGVKAIPEIAKLHPDFVFVDISMPVMDGLQMAEEVLRSNPAQKIFMLTAYRDFEYAKKSVSIGVADYILKNELSEQTLEKLILKNAADLETEKRKRHMLLEINLRKFFLSDDTMGEEEGIYQDKPLQRYVLLFIAPKPEIILEHEEKRYSNPLDCYAIENSIEENGIICRAFIEVLRDQYCGIFFAQHESGDIENKCRKAAEKIMEQFALDMAEHICIISAPVSRFSAVQTLYGKFHRKMDYLYTAKKSIYTEKELQLKKTEGNIFKSNGWISKWRAALENGAQDETDILLKQRLQMLRDRCDVWQYTERIREICRNMEAVLREKKFDPEILSMAASYTDIDVLETDLCTMQKRYFAEYRGRLGSQYSRYTLLAQEYIREHYARDISVADIAAASGVSEGHLRRCFKKEMNVSVVNYLTEYRLGRAKKLMENDKGNIDDIWKKTGFTSGQYFSYVFKKKEGITPRDYMRMANNVGKSQTDR